MKFFTAFALFLCCATILVQSQQQFDCGGADGSKIRIVDFTLFPNPVQVHKHVHLRAIINAPEDISKGQVSMKIHHETGEEILIEKIDLCAFTGSIQCPLLKGENIISFDYVVPAIPPGVYTLEFSVSVPGSSTHGCINFPIQVAYPVDPEEWYKSWYEAVLEGVTQYEKSDITQRTLGDWIQVGPEGYFPKLVSSTFPWGRISYIEGSEDLVPEHIDTSPFIWGLFGNMTQKQINTHILTEQIHTYVGKFFVGYIDPQGVYNYMSYATALMTGSFVLEWRWNATTKLASLSGQLDFDKDGFLQSNWVAPLTFGRLDEQNVTTTETGELMVHSSKFYCTNVDEPCAELAAAAEDPKDGPLSDRDMGLTIGIILGFVALLVTVVALLLWFKHKKNYDEEDGVFSVTRKPEYGSALVVDDIIQETKEHSGQLLPKLDRNKRGLSALDLPSDFSDDSRAPSPRRSGRGKDRRPSRPGRSTTRTDDSMSRARRSRSRSRSPSDLSSRSGRSVSRSRSPSFSDSYSVASDSSRSRSRGGGSDSEDFSGSEDRSSRR